MAADVPVVVDELRADARRNRAAILTAATRVFTESGQDVALDEIARAAGVGIATLYRRFPDRESLVHAVLVENLGAVLAEVRAARLEEASAWDGLVRAVGYSTALKLLFRLASAPSPAARRVIASDTTLRDMRRQAIELIDELVRGAQDEGSLRRDVRVADVVHLMAALAHAHRADDPRADAAFVRARAIVLDGLRHHDTPLPDGGTTT